MSYDNSLRSYPVNFSLLHASNKNPPHINNHPLLLTKMSSNGAEERSTRDEDEDFIESELKRNEKELENTLSLLKELEMSDGLPLSLLGNSAHRVKASINRNELRLNLHDIYDRSNLNNSVSKIQDGGKSSSLFSPSPHSDISQNEMGNSSVNALIQSIQEQIRATQQLTLQNEQENVMINQQLSSLMQRRQSTYESYGSTAIKATEGTMTRGSVEDEELVHMRLQHQKELEKLKFEQEKMQQERELEELKLSREKQRIEQKKIEEQQELDTWKQKMKTRREKAQTSGFLGFNQSSFSESDLSKQGFQIYFDFVTGLSPNIKAVSLVYAIYDCESTALKTPVRRAPVSETDIMLFNASEAEESNLERQSIFLVRRQYPRELLSIARPLKMILELLSVTNTSVPNDPLVVSIGWSVIEITNDQYFLNEGCFRLPLFAPHVDTSLKPNQLDQYYKRLQSALFVRIVSPANFRQMEAFPVSSETQSKYKVPDSFSVPKFVTGKGSSRASTPSEKKSILSHTSDETKTQTELISSVQSNPEISVDLKIDDPQTIEPIPLDAQPDTGETTVDFQRTGSVQSSPTDTLNSPTIIYDSSYGIGVQVQSCTNLPQTLGADKQFYVKVDLLYGSEAVEREHSQRYFSWETTSSNVEDSRAVTWEQQIVFSDFQYQKDANILLSLFMRAQDSVQKEESSNHGIDCTENSSVLLYWKVLPLFKLKFERNEMIANSGQFHLRLDEPPLDIQSISSKQISNYDDLPIIDVFLSNSSDSKPLPELSPDNRTTIDVQQRSGLVVCIDRAEYLPENVLFSRILVGYYSSNFDPLCGYEPILMQPDSCCLEPEYGYTRDFVWVSKRIRDQDTKDIDELRKSEFLSGTIIDDEFYVIIQMETVDPKMQKRDVGYAVLSLIYDRTSEEGKDTEKTIQYGQFKLPLHTMPFPCIEELRDGTYKNSPQLPCSSLMVRVCKMTTGGNGAILRRSSFPIKQWQALYGYKKGTIYEDTEPRHLANRKLQTTLKNKISASLRWKTARVVVDNLQQITKAKSKEISFLFDPMSVMDKDRLGNPSTEMVAKRMKTLFLKNSAESSLLVTPFIDQIGCILIPECLFIEAKYYQPGVMYFLVVKVFLVKDEARNTSNPDYVQIHISEEVDWTESRMGLIVWRRKPILVSHATKNYPISNIVVEMTVQYYSNSKEMLQRIFPISSFVDTSKEAAIRRNTALSRDTTSKGIKKLAQIVLGNRNRMKHREAMETMTPEELRRSYQGKPMNTFLKPLTRSGGLSARKSNGLKTLGWTLFSALLPGKEIGANPYLFTKSGRFLSPLIPGSIPADVYPSLLADKLSVQSVIAKHETNEPVGAVYFECFDAQRQHEFDWLSKRIFEEGNYNYLSKLHKYMPINHANLIHYINLVDMCKPTDYEEFLHESLIDACEVSRDNLEKSQIVYAVRDQVLTQCYGSLRSTLL